LREDGFELVVEEKDFVDAGVVAVKLDDVASDVERFGKLNMPFAG